MVCNTEMFTISDCKVIEKKDDYIIVYIGNEVGIALSENVTFKKG